MNRLQKLFSRKQKDLLSIYFTAGYPRLEDTPVILKSLQDSGVDIIEIGMPFSDPLADGPVIQQSSEAALRNGMSIEKLFKQLPAPNSQLRTPLILMGYLNPVLQYGIEKFCKDAAALGVDGLILPDLPLDEYLEEYRDVFRKHRLSNVFLITPQTPGERIRKIDRVSDSFIYVVSSASTTGTKSGTAKESEAYFKRIQKMKLKSPLMIGFGISDRKSFNTACEYASGAIIGTAFIKALSNGEAPATAAKRFIQSIR